MSLDEKIEQSISHIVELYLSSEENSRDWAIAWSGGKDSTATLALVIKALQRVPKDRLNKKIHVVMSDTKVENPEVGAYMHDQMESLKKFIKLNDLPITAQMVFRELKHSYFVLTLGRGYFLPMRNGTGRWCTQRLKIMPQDKALKVINPEYLIVGTRLSESASRAASIKKWSISDRIGEHVSLTETNTFMPIVDWTIDDVWALLAKDELPWTDTKDIRRIYKEATGECGINNPKGVENIAAKAEACGARFGCWLCPVVANDRSTEEMVKYHSWMEALSYYRELQSKVYGDFKPIKKKNQSRVDRSKELRKWEAINEKIKLITKCGYNRKGKRMPDGQGTFTLEARKFLFGELMDVQKTINRMRAIEKLPKLTLITQEEIEEIYKLWELDEKENKNVISNAIGLPISEIDDLLEGKISKEDLEDYLSRRKILTDKKKQIDTEK